MAAQQPPDRPVTLSVFMEGTSNPMDPVMTQIALFARLCQGTRLDSYRFQRPSSIQSGHYKLSFDGVGVTNGFWGVVLASGLTEQAQLVRQYVNVFCEARLSVKVNFVGLSRGGIGGIHVARELADFRKEQVLLNMLLFDPVPGDFVFMSRYVGVTFNAKQAMDISSVGNLGRVEILYPHEPLPDIALHSPIIPSLPKDCELKVDVLLGCHQGALFVRPAVDTCLAFAYIRDFLQAVGSQLNVRGHQMNISDVHLCELLDQELRQQKATTRCTHAEHSVLEIVRYPTGQFLNIFHQELLQRVGRAAIHAAPGTPLHMLTFKDEAAGT